MAHTHALIIGTTGSGKTSLARQFLQMTPRAVIVDPQGDYVRDPGVTEFRTFRELARALEANADAAEFRYAYNPDAGQAADGGFRAVMAFVYRLKMNERERLGGRSPRPLGVFLEEASIYSDASAVPEELDWLIRAGRKAGICVCSVVQSDTDIGKAIRRNVNLTVMFRLYQPSTPLRRMVPDVERAAELETLFGPGAVPEYGVHYLTHPPDVDPHSAWRAAVSD